MNGAVVFVPINHYGIFEQEAVSNGFLHEPLQRNLSEEVVLITAANVGMCSDEPALLDMG
jgi:hypothetical protein